MIDKHTVPVTDEQVYRKISQDYSGDITITALSGIYGCYRDRGHSVTDAWEKTLRAHLDAANKAEEQKKQK